MDEKVVLLGRVPLFTGAPRDGLDQIARHAEEVEVAAGTVLTQEGRHEGYFYVVKSGTIRIERGGRTINVLGPGDFLGEIALLDGGPRTATATTETPCRLLSLTYQRFHQVIAESEAVRRAVLEAVGQRLRALDEESVT